MAPTTHAIVPGGSVEVLDGAQTLALVIEDLADSIVKAHQRARSGHKRRQLRNALVYAQRAERNVRQLAKSLEVAT